MPSQADSKRARDTVSFYSGCCQDCGLERTRDHGKYAHQVDALTPVYCCAHCTRWPRPPPPSSSESSARISLDLSRAASTSMSVTLMDSTSSAAAAGSEEDGPGSKRERACATVNTTMARGHAWEHHKGTYRELVRGERSLLREGDLELDEQVTLDEWVAFDGHALARDSLRVIVTYELHTRCTHSHEGSTDTGRRQASRTSPGGITTTICFPSRWSTTKRVPHSASCNVISFRITRSQPWRLKTGCSSSCRVTSYAHSTCYSKHNHAPARQTRCPQVRRRESRSPGPGT